MVKVGRLLRLASVIIGVRIREKKERERAFLLLLPLTRSAPSRSLLGFGKLLLILLGWQLWFPPPNSNPLISTGKFREI